MAYRVFSVYTFRSVPCAVPATLSGARKLPPPDKLVVLTYNIEGHATLWNSNHLTAVADAIRAQKADIVGINELHRGSWQSRFKDQVADLSRMTGMNIHYGKSFDALGGEFGNAVLTRGTIRESTLIRLPGIGEPRTLLHTVIEIDGRSIDFLVTHIAAWGSLYRDTRAAQVNCIRDVMEALDGPAIVVGDFNASPEKEEMQALLNNPRLAETGIVEEATHKVMQNHIDYVIADRRYKRLVGGRVEDAPGDHWPVRIELERSDVTP